MTALASTLVHFLWQGTLVALALAAFLRYGPRGASARYVAGVAALALMCAAPATTFLVSARDGAVVPTTASLRVGEVVDGAARPAGVEPGAGSRLAVGTPADASPERYAHLVVLLWATGVVLLLIRLLGGWLLARRVTRVQIVSARPAVTDLASRVSLRMGLRRMVRVVESSACAVPVVIGWIRPVILLPVATVAGLPPAQLEALLAHELAHVRRHDYLVNLLQMVIETLLFYHPGVWWVSRRVRVEREHCCDDLAVSVCHRVDYAEALSALAAMNPAPGFALAATDGSLVARMRRLFADGAPRLSASVWFGAAAVVMLLAAIPVATVALTSRAGQGPIESATFVVGPSLELVRGADPSVDPRGRGIGGSRPAGSEPGGGANQLLQTQSVPVDQSATQTDRFLNVQIQEVERQLRAVADERMAAERTRASEDIAIDRARLEARLERLTAALQESKARAAQGLADGVEVRDIESQMVEVRGTLSAIEVQVRAREAEIDITRRERTLQEAYQSLLARSQTAAQRLAERSFLMRARERGSSPATRERPDTRESSVISVTHGRDRVSFTPRSSPYVNGGPAVTLPLVETGAKTPAGQPIAAIRFIGWHEGNATRVMALVSIQHEGGTTAGVGTSGELEQDAGSYLVRFGDLLELKDLEAFGISNVWLSSVAPVQ